MSRELRHAVNGFFDAFRSKPAQAQPASRAARVKVESRLNEDDEDSLLEAANSVDRGTMKALEKQLRYRGFKGAQVSGWGQGQSGGFTVHYDGQQYEFEISENVTPRPVGEIGRLVKESGKYESNGRGVYYDTGVMKHDMVIFQDHRDRWRLDLITGNLGTHASVTGPNAGYGSAEEAFQAALDVQRVRGIRGKSHVWIKDRDGNLSDYEPMQTNGRATVADPVAARELDLYIANTFELVGAPNSPGKSIDANLKRKLARGDYDPALAPRAWEHLVEQGAKRYEREFGSDSPIFNAATRRQVAADFARAWEEENMRQVALAPINPATAAPGYYVSARTGTKTALAAGPFDTQRAAERAVDHTRRAWADVEPESWHAEWGTARVRGDLQANGRPIPESMQPYADWSYDDFYQDALDDGQNRRDARLRATKASHAVGRLDFLPPRNVPKGWVIYGSPIFRRRDAKPAFEAHKGAKFMVFGLDGKPLSPELHRIRGLLEWRDENGWVSSQ